jgi:hypothetical protein
VSIHVPDVAPFRVRSPFSPQGDPTMHALEAAAAANLPDGDGDLLAGGDLEANAARAARALRALVAYAGDDNRAGEPFSQYVGDLIGDLRHLCDFAGETDFADLVARGESVYGDEIRGVL